MEPIMDGMTVFPKLVLLLIISLIKDLCNALSITKGDENGK